MKFIKNIYLTFILITFFSCSLKKSTIENNVVVKPSQDFEFIKIDEVLDYNEDHNWAFRHDIHNYNDLMPINYKSSDEFLNVSVFYIHPTTLYDQNMWNANALYFLNNKDIRLCVENQASVFAGITNLYVPNYRQMHIHSYTDTINGLKAFNYAYDDVLSSFQYFINNIKTEKYIIAAHSQGTNHAVRLINNYIANDTTLLNRLVLSYLIGMDIKHNEMTIPLCDEPSDLYCYVTWRSFDDEYYPTDWDFGNHIASVNPITFTLDTIWSDRSEHLGILFPNKRLYLKKTLSVANKSGLLWVRLPNNIFIRRYRSNSYHRADYNLYWLNIRENLKLRLRDLSY